MKVKFCKMSSAGNDFVLINSGKYPHLKGKNIAQVLCRRKTSIGADGLILIRKETREKISMRFFNPDGSETFCGNALRCCALWAGKEKTCRKPFQINTIKGNLSVEIKGKNKVKAQMPSVKDLFLNFSEISGKKIHFVDTGVPHAVIPVENLRSFDVRTLGRKVRYNSRFGKEGTNADFIKLKKRVLHVRTYERGVENETLSCGTGITASALVAAKVWNLKPPVKCISLSGENFLVNFRFAGQGASDIEISGPACLIFEGEIKI